MANFLNTMFLIPFSFLPEPGRKLRYELAQGRSPKLASQDSQSSAKTTVLSQYVKLDPSCAIDHANMLKVTSFQAGLSDQGDDRPAMNPESKRDWREHLTRLAIKENHGFAQLTKYVDGWTNFYPGISIDPMMSLETKPKNQALDGAIQSQVFAILGDVPEQVTVLNAKAGNEFVLFTSPDWSDGFLAIGKDENYWFPTYLDLIGVSLKYWYEKAEFLTDSLGVASEGNITVSATGGEFQTQAIYDFRGYDPVNGKIGSQEW